jgi:hypothetical protein
VPPCAQAGATARHIHVTGGCAYVIRHALTKARHIA